MQIEETQLSTDEITELIDKISKFIISDPNDELTEIYVISTLSEIIGLRAEQDYSAENQPVTEKKLGQYNPNYETFLGLVRSLLEKNTVECFENLRTWLASYCHQIDKNYLMDGPIRYTSNFISDIRLASNVTDCLSFLITRSLNELEQQLKAETKEEELNKINEEITKWHEIII